MTKYDGKKYTRTGTNLTFDAVATKQVDAYTSTAEWWKKGGKYHATVRCMVSKDGKTLTITAKGIGANGKAFASVAVFDRQ